MTFEEASILSAVKFYSRHRGAQLMDVMIYINAKNIHMSWVALYRILKTFRDRGVVTCRFNYLSLPNTVKPHIKPAMVLKQRVYRA